MRFPAEASAGRFARLFLTIIAAAGLAACGGNGSAELASAGQPSQGGGPEADYPVVLGEPYEIDGVTYTPVDTLNHDQAGIAVADGAGGMDISAAHRTLPLPSYVEVTSLETGRTILVRVTRRGPMTGTGLIALSQGALGQLELAPGTPVRVRRVNPIEQERALLRAGQQAPARIDTPMSLVEVLKRRLPGQGAANLAQPEIGPLAETADPQPPEQADSSTATPAGNEPLPTQASQEVAAPTLPPPVEGNFVVQAGAFANPANAERVAEAIGGSISRQGNLHLVRTGPFKTRAEAEASLAKVMAAGYREARIFTSG